MSRRIVAASIFLVMMVLAGCSSGSPPLTGHSSVDVGAAELSYWCEGAGTPTVIIDQGLFRDPLPEFDAADWYGWATALHEIADFAHVCVYNRRGVPNSDPLDGNDVRTSQDHVDDLFALVESLGLSEQLVLVGHSWGGLNLQLFTKQHADRVVGMVLVDSSHPQGSEILGPFPVASSPEWVDIPKSENILGGMADLGSVPLIVISQGRFTGATESQATAWAELQVDLTRLSSNSQHIVVPDSGHLVMIDRPDVIVDAVKTIVDQIP